MQGTSDDLELDSFFGDDPQPEQNSAPAPTPAPSFTVPASANWLTHFIDPLSDSVVELRALKCSTDKYRKPHTRAGTFDRHHLVELVQYASLLSKSCPGVYLTLNPVHRDLLSRRCNRQEVADNGSLTNDDNITCRRFILFDFDPIRISDVSSTDEEKRQAMLTGRRVEKFLSDAGWPSPIIADSGNGYHLLYRVDLPAADNDLIKKCLQAVAAQFNTDAVKIDTTVHNPSRIVKFYGTISKKGDDTEDRPHRRSGILKMPPGEMHPVPLSLLEALAATAPTTPARPHTNGQVTESSDSTPSPGFTTKQKTGWARKYLAKVPPAISGSGGHKATYHAAAVLIHGFALVRDDAFPLLLEWNQSCEPPWTESELLHKLEDAERATGERGLLLKDRKVKKKKEKPKKTTTNKGKKIADDDDPEKTDNKDDAASLDPVPTARDYIDAKCTHIVDPGDGTEKQFQPRLVFWYGEFFSWNSTSCKYTRLSVDFIRSSIIKYLDGFAEQITTSITGNILAGVKAVTILRDDVESPAWIHGKQPAPFPAVEMLSTKSGLVHLPTFTNQSASTTTATTATPADYRFPLTPKFFSQNCLNFGFNPTAPTPATWINFLSELWPNDPQSVEVLQEWFGYCLLPDTSQQKILMMIGPTRSGKGTIARILRLLVGELNVAAPRLANLGNQFGLWPLLGKTLAIVSDARLSGRTDSAAVAEVLLAISGEDAQTVERKMLDSITTKLLVRFMILTNELPKLGDSSGALAGRMILLKFTESFYGREDTTLTAKLTLELPGILLWAIAGWKRLRDRGHFYQPASGTELIEVMGELSSPISLFIRDCCNDFPNATCSKADLFSVWKGWCDLSGREHAGDSGTFGRNLRAALPSVCNSQPRGESNKRIESYAGIGLKEESKTALDAFRGAQKTGNPIRFSTLLKQWLESGDGKNFEAIDDSNDEIEMPFSGEF